MKIELTNCDKCKKILKQDCEINKDCICKKCPRNIEKCIMTRYCTETESILYL